jgi:poly(3-hydroxybutyrate) depolymerase
MTRIKHVAAALAALALACSSDAVQHDDAPASAQVAQSDAGGAPEITPPPAPAAGKGALAGVCPDGFKPQPGMNTGFPSGGKGRSFNVIPAATGEGPRPLFVSLTGTVQEEVAFANQSKLSELAAAGWIVISPVRSCSQEKRSCNQLGTDGRVWEPWFDGTLPPTDTAGPDVAFVEAMVRCVAATWPVAADQIYAGGISAGGSFTNRNLTFNSALFAGGVAASGNWTYGVYPQTTKQMDSAIAVVIWGGPTDTWGTSPPYAGETKAASDYYAKQPNVVTVSCTGSHGHMWPPALTPWLAKTLLSHPKGSDPKSFVLTPPPSGFSCVVGPYTDH